MFLLNDQTYNKEVISLVENKHSQIKTVGVEGDNKLAIVRIVSK